MNTITDAVVIGGGIAGLQVALDLADQGFDVVIVEKEPSIGGKMISLSKVFPTLDCSSCICTPRMAAAAHHERITIMTCSEVQAVQRVGEHFSVTIRTRPRYVIESACIGCRKCEYACPVLVPHEFEGNLGARRAIYVPFTNAMPQVALLDVENCTFCGACARACPTDAIDYLQEPAITEMEAGAVVVASGYALTETQTADRYGGGKLANVLTGLQMERLLAPHGPYGRVLRPSDGRIPDTVAFVQCAGSRDHSLPEGQGVPWCSRVCCMYAIKQAMLLSGSLPLVDITIYYMDIRAFGKGFEQFYQNARAMGINFVKARVARITEGENANPVLRIERIEEDGRVEDQPHDMVVLTPGIVAGWDPSSVIPVQIGSDGFVLSEHASLAPCRTRVPGVFVAGTASGPKDIPDSIVEAGAAAMEAANHLRRTAYASRRRTEAEAGGR
ncbi:MAG: CoB--CoM heterodisulfide reductase iron-sulfur subunit A family protein [Deltaproteobacteria bacterium]|nr:CoB--CoM heterodisulfide reductase iron-sulfur subunit A family protein [Deltaproteobacteria bacterium]